VRFSVDNLFLDLLDNFKLDYVLQVNATDGGRRYLLLTKSSMENLESLSQLKMSGFLQCG
jgi:hypothetical protein